MRIGRVCALKTEPNQHSDYRVNNLCRQFQLILKIPDISCKYKQQQISWLFLNAYISFVNCTQAIFLTFPRMSPQVYVLVRLGGSGQDWKGWNERSGSTSSGVWTYRVAKWNHSGWGKLCSYAVRRTLLDFSYFLKNKKKQRQQKVETF